MRDWTSMIREYSASLISLFFRLTSRRRYEFGGPVGVTAMVFGFPVLMYYLWICLWFYDGQLVHPSSVGDIQPFVHRMWTHVVQVSIDVFSPITS